MRLVPKNTELSPEEQERRKVLLGLIHIAKKELGWTDSFYREILEINFRVPTAASFASSRDFKLRNLTSTG